MAEPYEMTLSLNVLKHLGISLYSSNPAVLSEAVANAWDADASRVDIDIDKATETIVVTDDGVGMTQSEVNSRYLQVGYQRRSEPNGATSPSGRPVMGRKGIGKLALFSIARIVMVETARDGDASAFELNLNEIEAIMTNADPDAPKAYYPEARPTDAISFPHGTRITLTSLSKGLDRTASNLRRRLARRFSVLGSEHGFQVFIDGDEVTAADRDFAPSVQYIWAYGDGAGQTALLERAVTAEHKMSRRSSTPAGVVGGYLGTVLDTSKLRDEASGESLNKVPLMIRGKLAQENLLEGISEVGVYQNYLVGELHADFLDTDDDEDIATSSRQSIREDDERYQALIAFLAQEMKFIKRRWTDLRNEGGTKAALEIPEVKEWYLTIGADQKRRAERLFGKINQLGLQPRDRNELFAQGILAFEVMKQRENLDALDSLDPHDIVAIAKILQHSSQLEEAMYHRIVEQRLAVISKMDELVAGNELEKYLQLHLFEHLWLLDPGWERASLPTMEQSMKKAFEEIEDKLTAEEADSRVDIRYQRTSGQHVIVELKRAEVLTDTFTLANQIRKYRTALLTWLQHHNRENDSIAIVCVVGRPLRDWADPNGKHTSAEMLRALDARVLLYEELLTNAKSAYDEYLRKAEDASRVQRILDALSESVASGKSDEDVVDSGDNEA